MTALVTLNRGYTGPMDLAVILVGALALLVGALLGSWLGSRSARRLATAEAAAVLHQALGERMARIAALETELATATRQQTETEERMQTLLADTGQRFTAEFKALAGAILEEKTARFTETNRTRLDELLNPFRERLKEFQKRIEDNHLSDTRERGSLKEQLRQLMELNQRVSQEAQNLTTALKGETKTQGTWGEMILERVLNLSGLVEGREYSVQASAVNEEGRRQQPDVVIHLPPDRILIVDAKVSLVAFERYCNAADDETREAALAQHLASVRNHVRELGERNYPGLYGGKSPDFVLLFIPIEAAFLAAVQADTQLYEAAWRKNIVLVSPTTLMATTRVVESVWRIERQNRNALQIADEAGKMHDAFARFVEDLEKVNKNLGAASGSLEDALKKLSTGKGNLIGRAEKIRQLGAKTARELPAAMVGLSREPGDEPDGEAAPGTDLRH